MIRKDISSRILADGSELTIPVYHFPGQDIKAPSVYIQSGVHGAEVQGFLVIMHLIQTFLKEPPQGGVTLVPMANPYGMNNKGVEYTLGRFDPVTGENWNRNYIDLSELAKSFFKEHHKAPFEKLVPRFKQVMKTHLDLKLGKKSFNYAQKLALQLQSLSVGADIVLDLHCDTISVPHVYCPSFAIPSVTSLGIPFIIEIPHVFAGALDEATFCPWVELTSVYNEQHQTEMCPPVEAFTLELGGQELADEKKALTQVQGILNYLHDKKVVSLPFKSSFEQKFYSAPLKHFKSLHAPCGGIISKYAPLGKSLKEGSPLCSLIQTASLRCFETEANDFLDAHTSHLLAEEKSIPLTHSASPIIHEGMVLMKIMTHYKEVIR